MVSAVIKIALVAMLLCIYTFIQPNYLFAAGVDAQCRAKRNALFGKVQVVKSFPDLKVQVVKSFPDLKVQQVKSFPDKCGKWQFVDSFPDFKVQFVDAFPDIKIQFVDAFPGKP